MTVIALTYKSNIVHKVFASRKDAERYIAFCVKREADYQEAFDRYVDEGGDCPEFERDWPASLDFNVVEYEVERFKTA